MSNDDHLHIPADAAFSRRIPDNDDRERLVCDACDYVIYENPKIVTGVVATWGAKVLLVKREIEPRRGYWALPAGYMELHETAEQGATREAWEEARAKLKIDQLLAIYSIPQISQVQIIYRARLSIPQISAGPESQEVGLFDREEVPWNDLAFPTVEWALNQHYSVEGMVSFPPFTNPV
ncbi:NUDIX hydrolase [Kiloniella litopenaei]|uniref:NUDIX hydrolase n=1 Tax=Kiloniella litopenaei TaxID=1549748 RepID=A0A0M2R5M2_9PROT|nr:NUDIX hydrolase [Kiloniella litopenaei]KKJ76986.1 NUDIX hydrolase [Kiloniella litopenaei]